MQDGEERLVFQPRHPRIASREGTLQPVERGVDLPSPRVRLGNLKRRVTRMVRFQLAKSLVGLGFSIVATHGTAAALEAAGVPVTPVNKVHEGRPHIVDMMKNDEIALVVNTVQEKRAAILDSYQIRREALTDQIPTYTTLAGARAAATGLTGMRELVPYAIQSLHELLHSQRQSDRSRTESAGALA